MSKAIQVWWDWKEDMPVERLKEIGVYVYEDPMTEGSDTNGYIFSLEPVTPEMYKKLILEATDLEEEDTEECVRYFKEQYS